MSTENIEFLSKKVDGKKNEGAKLIEKNPKRRKAIMGCDTTNGRSSEGATKVTGGEHIGDRKVVKDNCGKGK